MKPNSGAIVHISNIALITFMLHIILFTNYNRKELIKKYTFFLVLLFLERGKVLKKTF